MEVVEQIYKRNPILRYSHHPLHSPLLPLPYGDIHLTGEPDPNISRQVDIIDTLLVLREIEASSSSSMQT